VGRPTLVCVLGALLAHALEGPADDRRTPELHLRVSEEEGVVLFELEYSGISIPADLRPNVFQPYFGKRKATLPPTGLQGIRDRARRWGGDFLMITEKEATTFRLIIPRAENAVQDDVLESVPRLRLEDYDD
jgi:signal transduction histidine kinase